MSFDRPTLLLLALLALPELALCIRRIPSFRASLELLAGPRRRSRAGRAFSVLSGIGSASGALFILFASAAMAGPSWGVRGVSAERSGLEAAIVLDASRSMEATDIKPSRLEAAKALIRSTLQSPRVAGAASGASEASFSLVATKGAATLLAPMTEDLFAFDDALDYATPDVITTPGTNLEAGIRAGVASFSPSGAQGRVLLLFTDGGELSGSGRRAIEALVAARARLVVVGIGTSQPALVPAPDGKALVGPQGRVRSVLDEASLRALAALAGGRYLDGSDAATRAALASELSGARGAGVRIEYERIDRGELFAFLAFAFLVLALLAELLSARWARA